MANCGRWRVLLLGILLISFPLSADELDCKRFAVLLRQSLTLIVQSPQDFVSEAFQRVSLEAKALRSESLLKCLLDEVSPTREDLILLLQGYFEKIAMHPDAPAWAEESGLRVLIDAIGFTASPSAARSQLEGSLEAANGHWDEVRSRMLGVIQAKSRLDRAHSVASYALFALQGAVTASILGELAYSHTIPERYCTPAGFLALCGVVGAQSIVLTRVAWPRFRAGLLRVLAPRHYRRLVNAYKEVVRVDPARGAAYLRRLATIQGPPSPRAFSSWGSVPERAARAALIEEELPETTQELLAAAIQYFDEGYYDTGIYALDKVLERTNKSDLESPVGQLALAVKVAVEKKSKLVERLSSLKRSSIFKRVLASSLLAGGATAGVEIGLLQMDSSFMVALQSTIFSIAGAFGMGKVASYLWLNCPTEKLRTALGGEIQQMKGVFDEMMALSPEMALPFLTSIASADGSAHPFIREAATEALFGSNFPKVAGALERLAQANIRFRGALGETAQLLERAIARHQECNQQLARLGLGAEWRDATVTGVVP